MNCKSALRVLKIISVKLKAYVMQQHGTDNTFCLSTTHFFPRNYFFDINSIFFLESPEANPEFYPTKKMQTFPPSSQFWSHFNRRCAMCWIELKVNFPIFIFWVIVEFVYVITIQISTKKKVLQKWSNLHERCGMS